MCVDWIYGFIHQTRRSVFGLIFNVGEYLFGLYFGQSFVSSEFEFEVHICLIRKYLVLLIRDEIMIYNQYGYDVCAKCERSILDISKSRQDAKYNITAEYKYLFHTIL